MWDYCCRFLWIAMTSYCVNASTIVCFSMMGESVLQSILSVYLYLSRWNSKFLFVGGECARLSGANSLSIGNPYQHVQVGEQKDS